MRRLYRPWHYLILVLLVIGLMDSILNGISTGRLLIPLVLVAVVFLLYKFPPNRWRSKSSEAARFREAAIKSQRRHPPRQTGKSKRKSFPFKVIEGSKNRDDEPRPPYH
ncbi:hypothetical protein [Cohnella laeviribosi]|uniref:hypothetical protein n=1 Tax=Cohnella laeviribosi TaxID=380174 RepID=UPI0003726778|nr:hypothetical protein [Cohnella laeviribosi]